jgi:hypothetical protein
MNKKIGDPMEKKATYKDLKVFLFSLNKGALAQIVALDNPLRDGIREADNTFRNFMDTLSEKEIAEILFDSYECNRDSHPEEDVPEILETLHEQVMNHEFDYDPIKPNNYENLVKDFLFEYWNALPVAISDMKALARNSEEYQVREILSGISEFLSKISEN